MLQEAQRSLHFEGDQNERHFKLMIERSAAIWPHLRMAVDQVYWSCMPGGD